MDYRRLAENKHVDMETGFLFRYIYSETELFLRHSHDFFEIFLVLEGKVLHEINGAIQKLGEGALVFIRPDDMHNYSCDNNKKCRFLNLTFTKQTAKELFDYFGDGFKSHALMTSHLPIVKILEKNEKERIFRRFQQINTLEMSNRAEFKFHMRAFLSELISTHFSEGADYIASDIPIWLEALLREMNLKENFAPGGEQMIRLSGKSREHLTRSMKKYLDITISGYVNNLRLNFAANMLLNSNMPVLDICFESGFENVSWFYSNFKKKYGQSPGQFRFGTKKSADIQR